MSLEMFLDEEVFEWSEAHKESLRVLWSKFNKGTVMWKFNQTFHSGLLANRNDKSLMYVVNAGIPHLSDFARDVAKERGLV
jgi:hypothetical protein